MACNPPYALPLYRYIMHSIRRYQQAEGRLPLRIELPPSLEQSLYEGMALWLMAFDEDYGQGCKLHGVPVYFVEGAWPKMIVAEDEKYITARTLC